MRYEPKETASRWIVPRRPTVKIERPESSIILNLRAINQAHTHQQQQQEQALIQSFTPLSVLPPPVRSSGSYEALNQPHPPPSVRDLELSHTAHYDMIDLPQKRRHHLLWVIVGLACAWALFVSAQVGVQKLLNHPLYASYEALYGPPKTAAAPQIEEVVERGAVEVELKEPTRWQGRWVLIEGVVKNTTKTTQSDILLTLMITFEGGAPIQHQLTCCESAPTESADKEAWLRAERARLTRGERASVEASALPSESERVFHQLIELPRGVSSMPKLSARVTFYDPLELD